MQKIATDKFGDAMFTELYSNYAKMPLEQFKQYCIGLVENNTVSAKSKKTVFINSIRADRSKDRMVARITNIMMSGEGLGVVQTY